MLIYHPCTQTLIVAYHLRSGVNVPIRQPGHGHRLYGAVVANQWAVIEHLILRLHAGRTL